MPYPPKSARDQTRPETYLDPTRNPVPGGTGNAHTRPATQNDSGLPLPIGFRIPAEAPPATTEILFMSGAPYEDETTVLVASIHPQDIIVEVPGNATYSVSTTTIGDDRPSPDGNGDTHAFYYGHQTITGLERGLRYSVNLRQNGTPAGDIDLVGTASFWSAPRADQTVNVFTGTCDSMYNTSVSTVPPGGWEGIYDRAVGSNRPCAVAFADDFGYTARLLGDGRNDSAGTGKFSTHDNQTERGTDNLAGSNNVLEYDYAIGLMGFLGMMTVGVNGASTSGRDPHRNWCMRNIPMLLQYGDHEFANDVAFLTTRQGINSGINPGEDLEQQWVKGRTVWNALFAPLTNGTPKANAAGDGKAIRGVVDGFDNPNSTNPLYQPNHWVHTFGPARIGAIDRVTNATADYTWPLPTQATPAEAHMVRHLGDLQIDDFLTAMANGPRWKLNIMSIGMKFMAIDSELLNPGLWQFSTQGPGYIRQHAIYHCTADEYNRMYVGGTDKEGPVLPVCKNPLFNGVDGVFNWIDFHGDTHLPMVEEHRDNEDAPNGVAREQMDSWCMGIMSQASLNTPNPGTSTEQIVNGEIPLRQTWVRWSDTTRSNVESTGWFCHATVSPAECNVEMVRGFGNVTEYEKTYT